MNTTRYCLACSKPLKGRIDKKFCNADCRNQHHNQINYENNTVVKEINRYLKSNRKVLSELLDGKEMLKCSKEELMQKSFSFRFFTHQYITKKGHFYNFCYEYGYWQIDDTWVLIVKRLLL